jgi:hypothetical protein
MSGPDFDPIDDVAERLVDLAARISTAEDLRAIYAIAESVPDPAVLITTLAAKVADARQSRTQ